MKSSCKQTISAPAFAAWRTISTAFSIFAAMEPGVVIWTSARWTVLLDFGILRFLVAAGGIAAYCISLKCVALKCVAMRATQRIGLRSERSG